MFSQASGSAATSVDMELSATQQLAIWTSSPRAPNRRRRTSISTRTLTPVRDSTGIDFILDEPLRGADLASLAPTVESQLFDPSTVESTQEVSLENLGLEVDGLGGLEDAEDLFAPASSAQVEDTVERPARPSLVEDTAERPARPSLVEDTVERPMRRNQVEDTVERPARRAQVDDTVERPAAHRGAPPVTEEGDTHRRPAIKRDAVPAVEQEDTFSGSGITRGGTQTLKIPKVDDTGIMPLLDPTGELPTLDPTRIQGGPAAAERISGSAMSRRR